MVNNATQAPQAQQRANNGIVQLYNGYKHDAGLAKKLVQNMSTLCSSFCNMSRIEPIDNNSNHSEGIELQDMQSTEHLQSSDQKSAEFLPLAIKQMLLNHPTNQSLVDTAPQISIFTNHLNKSYEHEAQTELKLRHSPESQSYAMYSETGERIQKLPILPYRHGENENPSIYGFIKEAALELNEIASEDGEVNSEGLGAAISKYAPSLKLLIKDLSADETSSVIQALIQRHCLFHMAQYIYTENSEKLSDNDQEIRNAFERTFSSLRRELKDKIHDKVGNQLLFVLGFVFRRSLETGAVGSILAGFDATPTNIRLALSPLWAGGGILGALMIGLPQLGMFYREQQLKNSNEFWDQLPLSREQVENYFSIDNEENISVPEAVEAETPVAMVDDVPAALDRV